MSSVGGDIDAGRVKFALSAYLGGFGTQGDNASVFVNYSDASHGFVDQSFLSPVSASDRGNTTGLLLRSASGTVPSGTRYAQVQIHFERTDPTYNDGYADNLSYVLTGPATTGSIAGTVFNDANNNAKLDTGEAGLSNVTVYNDANNNGKLDSGEGTTKTGSGGAYAFVGVPAGTYRIRAVAPTGSGQTLPTSNGGYTVTLAGGQAVTGDNFGEHTTATVGTISGNVFNDANNSGTRNSGEAGLAGVIVYNDSNKNGKFDSGEGSTTTTSSGTYAFTGVPAGTYTIRAVAPTGYTQTLPTSNGGYTVTLSGGQTVVDNNFGEYKAAAGSISGTVFNDADGDGTFDTAELGLGLWQVYVDANNNGKLDSGETVSTTDVNGAWSFTGLSAGTYVIRVVQVAKTSTTTSGGAVQSIAVTAGQSVVGKLFGEKRTA